MTFIQTNKLHSMCNSQQRFTLKQKNTKYIQLYHGLDLQTKAIRQQLAVSPAPAIHHYSIWGASVCRRYLIGPKIVHFIERFGSMEVVGFVIMSSSMVFFWVFLSFQFLVSVALHR